MRKTVAVVICYHPVVSTLLDLSSNLHLEGVPVVWVNNGPEGSLDAVRGNHVLHVLELKTNLGVAAALNTGFQWAIDHQFDAVITFDQDSKPQVGMVGKLLQSLAQASAQSIQIAAIGPATIDDQSAQALFSFEPYRWIRRRFLPQPGKVYAVDHLISSGCLVPCDVWQEVGPMNEGLFIDWVDIEWCARARLKGYTLVLDGSSQMNHSIGDSSRQILWRRFHLHTPIRHFYLLRNALAIAKKPQFNLGWRVHLVLYAARVILASLAFGDQRISRLRFVWRGLVAGLRGQQGQML